jgi:hypothetical protein
LHALWIASGPPIINHEIATLHPSCIPKTFDECADARFLVSFILGGAHKQANSVYPPNRLRVHRKWPDGCRSTRQL